MPAVPRTPARPAETAEPSARPRGRRRARPGPEARERRRRLFRYAVLLISAAIMVNALVGEKGYLATIQARQSQQRLEESLRALEAENARLKEQAERLKSDPRALEEAARENLGLVRPGETLVTVRDRAKDTRN